jgi:hypothetical protein
MVYIVNYFTETIMTSRMPDANTPPDDLEALSKTLISLRDEATLRRSGELARTALRSEMRVFDNASRSSGGVFASGIRLVIIVSVK